MSDFWKKLREWVREGLCSPPQKRTKKTIPPKSVLKETSEKTHIIKATKEPIPEKVENLPLRGVKIECEKNAERFIENVLHLLFIAGLVSKDGEPGKGRYYVKVSEKGEKLTAGKIESAIAKLQNHIINQCNPTSCTVTGDPVYYNSMANWDKNQTIVNLDMTDFSKINVPGYFNTPEEYTNYYKPDLTPLTSVQPLAEEKPDSTFEEKKDIIPTDTGRNIDLEGDDL